ncbi:MAG TPA: hypothetical protein VF178_03730 [Gemmatimonadaceae bacterium]
MRTHWHCGWGLLLVAAVAPAQAPSTDIFLVPLGDGGRSVAGSPRNLTAREGYDNQPFWTTDGRALWFSSVREGEQSDIYRLEIASGAVTRVTTTSPESEYSPTLMPGGDALSVVRVERDSTQRLWRVPLGGGASTLVLEQVRPVGYHAWIDSSTVVLFVLGSPNTLQLANVRTGRVDTVTTGVGRSLHRVPGARRASFVKVVSREESWIMTLDPDTRATERVVRLPAGVQDYAWLPDGSVLIGEGSVLKRYDPRAGGTWTAVGELPGVTSITRLAVSPRGDAVAVVGVPR